MECDADGRERMLELRLKPSPAPHDDHLPAARRVRSAALAEVMYGTSVAAYTLGGRATQLHPFSNAVLLPGCRWRLGGRLDGSRAAARYFDESEQAPASAHSWSAPHEAAVAAADTRTRDRAWSAYLAGAIAHAGHQNVVRTLLARATAACGTLPLSCRLVHLCAQPTPAAARLLIDTLHGWQPLAHRAWVAAAALAPNDTQAVLQQGVQWMLQGAGDDVHAVCGAVDLWLRLMDALALDAAVASIDAVVACRAAPGAAWTAVLGQQIQRHGLGACVWPACLHVLLTGTLPPLARWRLGYPQQPLVVRCMTDPHAPLAFEVVQGPSQTVAVLGRVWEAIGDAATHDDLALLLSATHVAAVPMWAVHSQADGADAPMHNAVAQITEAQTPMAALHTLLACGRAMLHDDAAEMQAPRVLVLVCQSLAHALQATPDDALRTVLGTVAARAAHALINAVHMLPPVLPISGLLVPEPWPLCPLQCPWIPLPTLDGAPLVLGLQPLLPSLPAPARAACLEHLADVSPMPGCVPTLLLDACMAAELGAQAQSWAVPLVVGAAAAARPPCVDTVQRVVQLLEADKAYRHAAAELRSMLSN